MSSHTRASYVGTILTMVMIVHHGSHLSMSRNRAIIKTLAANLSTYTTEPSRRFNFIYDDDDDYEESTIPLDAIDSQKPSPIAITPILPTMKPEDSLIIGDEDLHTISEKESDEFIKSSVEDLVLILSEYEDTSDSECDLPFCGDEDLHTISEKESNEFIKSSVEDLVPILSEYEDTSDSECDLPFCEGDVVLRQSYKPESCGKLYSACPKSKPPKYFRCGFFYGKRPNFIN
nr:hypothetical protein [Tanacetum cinerariifolium]